MNLRKSKLLRHTRIANISDEFRKGFAPEMPEKAHALSILESTDYETLEAAGDYAEKNSSVQIVSVEHFSRYDPVHGADAAIYLSGQTVQDLDEGLSYLHSYHDSEGWWHEHEGHHYFANEIQEPGPYFLRRFESLRGMSLLVLAAPLAAGGLAIDQVLKSNALTLSSLVRRTERNLVRAYLAGSAGACNNGRKEFENALPKAFATK